MVRRVVFIRSGETDWNKQGRWQGWVASPLNIHGKRQAEALGRFVRNIGLSALYTSDLRRALQTAEALAAQLPFDPEPDERLRERAVGLWQGLTVDEMESWYPEEFALLLEDREQYIIPGGESRAEVRERMHVAFDDLVSRDAGETIGILSHTAAIKFLLDDLISAREVEDFDLANASVTTIRRNEDGWELVAADDKTHLEGLASSSVTEPEERR